jgi:hypothetical protein
MKIITVNKTLNEAANIERYCRWNDWADLILIADGGSIDETVALAGKFANVRVRPFEQRVTLPDGSFMNPEPAHFNFLIEWAESKNADWIVLTGGDEWPNKILYRDARSLFNAAELGNYHGITVHRLYLWGNDQYFPKINEAGPALWAWSPKRFKVRCDESGDTFFDSVMPGPDPEACLRLDFPYVLMHYYAGPDITPAKLERYKAWGYPQVHPLESIYAPPVDLPEWAREWQT